MASSACPDRVAFGHGATSTSYAQLERDVHAGAAVLRQRSPGTVAFLGQNSPVLPMLLFVGAAAQVPVAPLNFRLPRDVLRGLVSRLESPVVVAGPGYHEVADDVVRGTGWEVLRAQDWIDAARATETAPETVPESAAETVPESAAESAAGAGRDSAAVFLFTSGTTAEPKG